MALKGSPKQRLSHSSNVQVSHVYMRFFLMGESRNSHMLVLKSKPLRRDACKPKQWIRKLTRCLFTPYYLWGHQSTGLSAGRCSDGFRLPCLSWEATTIGMASGILEVYLISRVVAIGMTYTIPMERASTVFRFGLMCLSL